MKNKIKGHINKLLYETRLGLNLDIKQASKLLHISKLKLNLIEKGYWSVSKKLQPRFIKSYKLDNDFFEINSQFVKEIDHDKEHFFSQKAITTISKKWFRYMSLGIAVASTASVVYGSYCLVRNDKNPRIAWTSDFESFYKNMQVKGEESASLLYLDSKYTVSQDYSYDTDSIKCSVVSYGKDENAWHTTFSSKYVYNGESSTEFTHLLKGSTFEFNVIAYNRKKLIYSSFIPVKLADQVRITNCTGVIDEDGLFELRPFEYIDYSSLTTKKARPGDPIFDEFNVLFKTYAHRSFFHISDLLSTKQLGYNDANDLIDDIQKISRDFILHTRLGTWIVILGSLFALTFYLLMSLSFYFFFRHKKKTMALAKPSLKQTQLLGIKDSKIRLFIPEMVLRIIGLIIIALASTCLFLTVYSLFNSDFSTFLSLNDLQSFTKNFSVAGILVLFFIKLDIYAKRSSNRLFGNIILFLLAGIVFYIAELVVYNVISGGGNIISAIFRNLYDVIPGNIFWNLGLYALLFYFLFPVPEKLQNKPEAIIKFRCCSIIPTVLLGFSLLWTLGLKNYVNAPYWVSFWFYSKSAVLTIFVLIYIYALFAYQSIVRRKYGRFLAERYYFNSKKYFLIKNSIASVTIAILLIMDICFNTLLTNNGWWGGQYWAIGILIPLILFYHPHIGKRNKAWDNAYLGLYGVSMVGGYVGAFIEIAILIGLNDILFAMF